MLNEFTYIRRYIILQNKYTNIPDIKPKGYGKIEIRGIKGMLNLNIENAPEDRDYRIYLLKTRGRAIEQRDIGRIIINQMGKSKTNIPLNLRELRDKDFSIDQIDAILIGKGTDILLAGYIKKDNGAIDRFIKQITPEDRTPEEPIKDKNEEPQPKEKEPEETKPEEAKPKEIEPKDEELEQSPIKEPPIEKIETEGLMMGKSPIEKAAEPPEDKQKSHIKTPSTDDAPEERIVERLSEELPDYPSIERHRKLNHKNQMDEYILGLLKFFPNSQPLRTPLHGYSWWQIDGRGANPHKGILPYYNYLMGTNYRYPLMNNSTTCISLIKKYGHYLFGTYTRRGEVKYYIYGVPGRFELEEQPFRGITGFNTWYESTEGLGYWIIYIEPITGKIIHPINPMIPKN
mgnify:CR=1 FL=1